ncbi:Transcription termination/antitermination protein NusG [bioreactor metagenome]|uniref:Transcription termination/antitermination protein NusG n=1 Tax=bioreactor metagenome TaxID=1076179 RepID=A0A645EW49_9ZZZZ|nr:transcription termination/antitermination protein NusG [Oscillospiraceae bacterium]
MLQDNETPHWYVVHTYSGYENRVAANLEKIVENRKLSHLIQSVKIPIEKIVDPSIDKVEERKLFPSYVLVKMIMNDESWHVVRNTSGVTGFVGPGSQPVMLRDDEVEALGVDTTSVSLSFKVGDFVRVIQGPLAAHITSAVVDEISPDFKRVKVTASLHGRNTPIELDTSWVEKIDNYD